MKTIKYSKTQTILLLSKDREYKQINNIHKIDIIDTIRNRAFNILDIVFISTSNSKQIYNILSKIESKIRDNTLITIIASETILNDSKYHIYWSILGTLKVLGLVNIEFAYQDIIQKHLYKVSDITNYDLIEASLSR